MAALLIVPLLITFLVSRPGPRPRLSLAPGQPAPDCQLTRMDRSPLVLSEFRGKPLVINFWATWCAPCRAEYELLQHAAARFDGRVQFLGIIYQDEPRRVKKVLEQMENRYPHLVDAESQCATRYAVTGVPETVFVDGSGVVRNKRIGPLSPTALEHDLSVLLNDKGQAP